MNIERNYLTLEEMGLASFIAKPSETSNNPYGLDAISQTASLAPVSMATIDLGKDKYSGMCDDLKEKAEEAKPMLPLGTTEVINRIVNKLYDLAQDIKLTMDGY
jgi:hypothetical protein